MKKAFAITVAILLAAIAFQALKIERQRVKYAELQTSYASEQAEQALTALKNRALKELHYLAERKKADETIKQLESKVADLSVKYTDNERLLNEAEHRLHRAEQSANRDGSEDARQAIDLCANLYRKLDKRLRAVQSRVGVLSEYADRLEIELGACLEVK